MARKYSPFGDLLKWFIWYGDLSSSAEEESLNESVSSASLRPLGIRGASS